MDHGRPLIINLAPTGMVPTRATSPHVPLTVDEILADVARCRELGASIVHVHARDDDGEPTHRRERFEPIVAGIRQIDPELVVCVTCSGRFVGGLEERADVLELTGAARPDMASLTLGSNNFRDQASVNAPATIEGLARRMAERGVKPELEAFEPGMVHYGRRLVERGLIEEPCYVNVLLGNPGTSPPTPAVLAAFLEAIPDSWTWATAGIGSRQLEANVVSIATGGHVRVGLEDNVWWDRERTRHATNAELVRRLADVARLMSREIASPAEVRRRLGLEAAATAA